MARLARKCARRPAPFYRREKCPGRPPAKRLKPALTNAFSGIEIAVIFPAPFFAPSAESAVLLDRRRSRGEIDPAVRLRCRAAAGWIGVSPGGQKSVRAQEIDEVLPRRGGSAVPGPDQPLEAFVRFGLGSGAARVKALGRRAEVLGGAVGDRGHGLALLVVAEARERIELDAVVGRRQVGDGRYPHVRADEPPPLGAPGAGSVVS